MGRLYTESPETGKRKRAGSSGAHHLGMLNTRSYSALALELHCIALMGTLLAELQPGAQMILQETVLGTELAMTMATITHHAKWC